MATKTTKLSAVVARSTTTLSVKCVGVYEAGGHKEVVLQGDNLYARIVDPPSVLAFKFGNEYAIVITPNPTPSPDK